MGLSISGTSPLKPGFRGNCFVRMTNLSGDSIKLPEGFGFAQVCFFKLDSAPESTYAKQKRNHFQDETAFRGLGGYESDYSKFLVKMEEQKDDLEKLQSRIYLNVISLLGIFSAVIALLITNVQAFSAEKSLGQVVMINIAVIASVAVLMLFVRLIQKWRR